MEAPCAARGPFGSRGLGMGCLNSITEARGGWQQWCDPPWPCLRRTADMPALPTLLVPLLCVLQAARAQVNPGKCKTSSQVCSLGTG